MAKEFKVIGKRVERVDAFERLTGEAKYAADIYLPGMLYVKILRSPHPHAKVVRIDASRAAGTSGGEGHSHGRRMSRISPSRKGHYPVVPMPDPCDDGPLCGRRNPRRGSRGRRDGGECARSDQRRV